MHHTNITSWSIILTWDGDSLAQGQPVAIIQGATGLDLLQEVWKSQGKEKCFPRSHISCLVLSFYLKDGRDQH